ncbi:MAG TPA: 50S ribosomal protein L9 [Acidimicrobiia bacterium]|nr:50S ribosomal protein L9 [Acidimicrobiia bacterium]
MKLILVQDVETLGRKGDVVDVADGYGRNYLVPRSLAVRATRGAMEDAETVRAKRTIEEENERRSAEEVAQMLEGGHVVVAARAADEGKLFGSIGARDVAEAIVKYTGAAVEPDHIRLAGPIKEIGLHTITVSPHPEVSIEITLDVIPA